MSVQEKSKHELKSFALTTLYSAAWLGVLTLLRKLTLAEYRIPFRGFSPVLVGPLDPRQGRVGPGAGPAILSRCHK